MTQNIAGAQRDQTGHGLADGKAELMDPWRCATQLCPLAHVVDIKSQANSTAAA